MSIEKITSKIVSDAEKIAGDTLNEAKVQSDGILAEANKKAEEIIKEAAVKGSDEKEKLISRRKAVAEIDGRKIILQQKQQLIAECFDKAVDKIVAMEKDDYIKFLAKTAKNTGITQGEVIMNEKDAKNIGPEFIEVLAKEIPGSKITLSEEKRNIKGGFLLRNGSVYINGTIEALLEEAKEDLVGEVAGILFQ